MGNEELSLTKFGEDQLVSLAAQLRDAQRGKESGLEQLAQAAVGAVARSEAAALEARILSRFLTDM